VLKFIWGGNRERRGRGVLNIVYVDHAHNNTNHMRINGMQVDGNRQKHADTHLTGIKDQQRVSRKGQERPFLRDILESFF